MANEEKDKPLNRDEAILMIAKALGLKTDLGKKPTEKKNRGGLTGKMKKKTKYMAKGGAGMKKTKYMAKGGMKKPMTMKKTMGYARGGASKKK